MNIIPTSIENLLLIESRIFGDHRGFFYESFNNDSKVENYMIKIIDDNVNVIEFDNTKSLLINKTGYEIV